MRAEFTFEDRRFEVSVDAPTIAAEIDLRGPTYEVERLQDGLTINIHGVPVVPSAEPEDAGNGSVVFYDYDGTVVARYTPEAFAALDSMPDNPEHSGLTAQGWNWSLADAKAYVAAYGRLNVGQMYITDDGKTRVYIHLEEGRTSPMLGVCPNGTVDVDWGDGTAHDTLTGTSTSTVKWTPTHAYAAPGDYVIKLTVTGEMGFYAVSDIGILSFSSAIDRRNIVYENAIRKVEIGDGVTSIGSNAFYYCHSLSNIVIPNGVTSIGSNAFYYCYSLSNIVIPSGVTSISGTAFIRCYSLSNIVIPNGVTSIGSEAFGGCYSLSNIVIPNGVTSIGSYAFHYCYSLSNIIIPNGVTSIGSNAFHYCCSLSNIVIPNGVTSIGDRTFYYCYSLSNIVIPSGVTSISGSAFYYCYGMAAYHLHPTAPPTLGTYAFTDIPDDCIIYVPYSADHSILEAYKTAQNWSAYADRMVEESAGATA